MRIYDIIDKKKNGLELSEQEINFFIREVTSGGAADYQIAAWCMAVCLRGMTARETAYLTLAVRDSGEKVDFSDITGVRVDKHSTGGVGDKTSLITAPIAAALGQKVAKMSGRGLGHTGGTIDKLESIEGFNCALPLSEFKKIVNETGLAIIGQTQSLAPADKKLYAVRDVTATVDSIPLIASSIMGKKLCVGDDCIVLDVKTGSGAFMKTREKSEELAKLMVDIGKRAGRKICAVISDMSEPLGRAIGNAIEVKEAISVLSGVDFNERIAEGSENLSSRAFNGGGCGNFNSALTELSLELAAQTLFLSRGGELSAEECKERAKAALLSGEAKQKLAQTISAQGGNANCVNDFSLFARPLYKKQVLSPKSGFVYSVNAEDYGKAALTLGAGRTSLTDKIDYTAGVYINVKRGEFVSAGEPLVTLYSSVVSDFSIAERLILNATEISSIVPAFTPVVLSIVY